MKTYATPIVDVPGGGEQTGGIHDGESFAGRGLIRVKVESAVSKTAIRAAPQTPHSRTWCW